MRSYPVVSRRLTSYCSPYVIVSHFVVFYWLGRATLVPRWSSRLIDWVISRHLFDQYSHSACPRIKPLPMGGIVYRNIKRRRGWVLGSRAAAELVPVSFFAVYPPPL